MNTRQKLEQHAISHGWERVESLTPRDDSWIKGKRAVVILWDTRSAVECASLWSGVNELAATYGGKHQARRVWGWFRSY